jgi:hypothetical protein
MPTELLVPVVGAISGVLGAVLTYVVSNRKIRVDSISAEAAADLARAQASGEVLAFMREDYNRMRELYDQALTEMATLRSEVGALRETVQQFEAVVMTLPDEYRGRFAEVLTRRAKQSPKALMGEG